ncbi:EAL domain-containing protein [Rhodoferax sp. WC2427]|uniref:EAL domain-containing protein n=1 Tax=Rhodoferax sp. WC2427 TaxID=3234144 RepID=UPI003465AE01
MLPDDTGLSALPERPCKPLLRATNLAEALQTMATCQFEPALNSLGSQIAIIDQQGTITYVNQDWIEFGVHNGTAADYPWVGSDYLEASKGFSAVESEQEASLVDGIRKVLSGLAPTFDCEYSCHSPDERRWFVMRVVPLHTHPGLYVVSHHNITRRKEQLLAGQAALEESALHSQAVLDNMVDGVVTIDMRGRIQSFNQAASRMFQYTPAEVLERNVSMLMPEPHRGHHDGYLLHFQHTGEARVIGKPREVEGVRKNGEVFPMSLSVSQIMRSGQPTFIGIVRDITQRRLHDEEIRRLAFYDPLTRLPNRRLLMDRLHQAMASSCRSLHHGAVMFLDLDHFKQLNDGWGHDVGDELLQQVAARLNACVREADTVARLGGDEFVVLLEALSPLSSEAATQAEAIANKILYTLGQSYKLRGQMYDSTPSIGIVLFAQDRDSMEDLLKKADVAMYQAKSAGRNTARFYDPAMQAVAMARTELERDLRHGLSTQQFVLHYQIQVDSKGVPTGAEALVRWQHPLRGRVSPGDFIPLAEETGLILPLGQWVLETACTQLQAWAQNPTTDHWSMAVNVSAWQFAQVDFVAHVTAALAKTGARPHLLKLELTESMLVNDVDDVIAKMNAIKAYGVNFSLDDFGTGYSSLSHLKSLPLDQLKIDQSFVRDVLTDPSDAVIARTIVALGHSLGLKVIAEGVETAEQRHFLAGIGCDAFQGYYFGRPEPADMLAQRT